MTLVLRLAGLSLAEAMAEARLGVEAQLRAALRDLHQPVAEAMLYAIAGGKCLRGFLVLEGARLHGFAARDALPAAAAVECIHAYSLVHDDLPCMDDDDLRRGRPSVHRKWDEATAVLAGDGLQALAFEQITRTGCPPPARLDLVASLARAAGIRGMVGGQALDIAAATAATAPGLDEITILQAGKTGALITWSAAAGARMAGVPTGPLAAYGDALGLAFQIADDILDVTGDAARTGKAVGKDAGAGKATFVSVLGLDGARARAHALVAQAESALAPYGATASTLIEAARFVISRDN